MLLFYVQDDTAVDGSAGCADLFVHANSALQAIDLWREYYELKTEQLPERVFSIVSPTPNHEPRALPWHSSRGALEVYRKEKGA